LLHRDDDNALTVHGKLHVIGRAPAGVKAALINSGATYGFSRRCLLVSPDS
jgi:hypothetical protein